MTKFSLFLTRKVRMRSSVAIAVLGLIAASLIGASMAAATPFLSASAGEGGSGATELQPCSPAGGVVTSTTGAPVTSQAICGPTAFGRGDAKTSASIGKLGVEANGTHFGNGTGIFMDSDALYSDTVVFSGPGNDPVLVRMNLHFAGSLAAPNHNSIAQVTITAIIDRTFVGVDRLGVESGAPSCPDIFPNIHFSGIGPCGFVYDATLQSVVISVPQDVPIAFSLEIDASGGGSDNGSFGQSHFFDTFGFIVNGPVFELPEGFTANSPTSFIVNNRFVPPDAVVPPVPGPSVPGPSTVLLLTSALGLVAILRRCRA